MSFREMAEMMTALPRGKFNPFPSYFKTRMQKLPHELKYNQVTTQIGPPQDFFFFFFWWMGSFPCWISFEKAFFFFPSWEQEGAPAAGGNTPGM